jgi:hypothetical protein
MRMANKRYGALLVLAAVGVSACSKSTVESVAPNPIVGTWVVSDPGAPFPYHMYVFNADGTMQQANPDAGDPRASDSDGKGVWIVKDGEVRGKWVEIIADRSTHKYTGRAEISFKLKAVGDTFTGTDWASSFDTTGKRTDGPTPASPFEGTRVMAQ